MTKRRFFHPDDLTAIRESCDWRKLLDDLGVRADLRRCTGSEFWGYSPFHPDEKTASFHMKDPGIWYDWSSHATAPGRDKSGGGVIELVQAVHAARGQILKLNEAASWLVDQGYSRMEEPAPLPEPQQEAVKEGNNPITIDLVPRLTQQGTHPEAEEKLTGLGVTVTVFDWEQEFGSGEGEKKAIPEAIKDPCDFSAAQLRWLRGKELV